MAILQLKNIASLGGLAVFSAFNLLRTSYKYTDSVQLIFHHDVNSHCLLSLSVIKRGSKYKN